MLQINAPPSVPASRLRFSSTGNTAGVSRRQLTTGIVEHTPLAFLSDRNSPQALFNTHFHWWCFSLACSSTAVSTGGGYRSESRSIVEPQVGQTGPETGRQSECWSHRWDRPDLKQGDKASVGATGGTDRT